MNKKITLEHIEYQLSFFDIPCGYCDRFIRKPLTRNSNMKKVTKELVVSLNNNRWTFDEEMGVFKCFTCCDKENQNEI